MSGAIHALLGTHTVYVWAILSADYAILEELMELRKNSSLTYAEMSEICGISAKELRNIVSEGRKKLSRKNRVALQKSIPEMKLEAHRRALEQESVVNRARIASRKIGHRYFAAEILKMDAKNFSKIIFGKNRPSWKMIERIKVRLERVSEPDLNSDFAI